MAKTYSAKKMCVVAAAGVLVALLGSTGAAQGVRQVRPRQLDRLLEQPIFLELVLLPEPIPFPAQVPPPEPAAPPTQVTAADQAAPTAARPERLDLNAGTTPLSERTPVREQAPPVDENLSWTEAPLQVSTFQTPDVLPPPNLAISTKDHPAVGAWFGQAIQVCPAGVAPAACNQGTPAYTLFMTPTLLSDGLFVADDTASNGGPPDGPHTTAFGQWYPTSATEFTADYVFMTNTYPVIPGAIQGLRARWVAKVIDSDTIVGWVNAYLVPKTPLTWHPLQYNEFPTIPAEGLKFVTSPNGFYTDPLACQTPGCPVLVLKFTVKRIKQ